MVTHILYNRKIQLTAVLILLLTIASCTPYIMPDIVPSNGSDSGKGNSMNRVPSQDCRKVLLLYSAGFNSISEYLREDIQDLEKGWLPADKRSDDVLLVYSHLPKSRGQYKTVNSPVLFRLYTDEDGTAIKDTLIVYDEKTVSASANQLKEVLTYVSETFPAKSYGMIFSSHATGYLPAGFYGKADSYIFKEDVQMARGLYSSNAGAVPYFEVNNDPDMPAVKSIGQDVRDGSAYEIDLRDFAQAIPMKLDYILFDACLMGGIEAAYELSGKCDLVGFSQAEVLAEGFNYSTLTTHLLGNEKASDPEGVCYDYFQQYDIMSGVHRSATISLVDCNKLSPLSEFCAEMFEKYRDQIETLSPSSVQRFYRSYHHWFYDMESILSEAGMTEEETEDLHEILDNCIVYKGHTPEFMCEFAINTFSGFSMYLPCNGTAELDKYYRTLKWNQDTGLIL